MHHRAKLREIGHTVTKTSRFLIFKMAAIRHRRFSKIQNFNGQYGGDSQSASRAKLCRNR